MKQIKRISAVILAILMIATTVPFAFAGTVSGTCGSGVNWSYDTDTATLTISGSGRISDYKVSGLNGTTVTTAPWRNYYNQMKSVVIEDGVTSIGNYAFYGCSSLTSVTIPDSVTSIGRYAFYGCSSLTSVTIPDSVTSIGHYAFINCSSLTSVTIPDSVTSIGIEAFEGCSSLTSVTIPDSVTSIGNYAFSGCSSLTEIKVSANNNNYTDVDGVLFNKSKTELIQYPIGRNVTEYLIPDSVTSIGDWAFRGCSSLTNVTIGNSVTSIGYSAFRGCSSLTSVTIPDSVTSIGDSAFEYCRSLKSVTIPDSVTSIGGYAFRYCSRLTSVTIPDSVTSIGGYAFRDCSRLTSVTIPDSVTSIGNYAFSGCSSLTEIKVSANNNNYTDIDGVLFNKSKTELIQYPAKRNSTEYVIPDSVTSIDDYAFYYCSSLTSVTIPDSVTSTGDYAFYDCSNLTSVTIPDSVTSIGDYAFYYCSSLTSVTIPDSVTSIGVNAFYYCSSLTSVTIGNSVTSIGNYAFEYCRSLTSVTIGNSVTSIGSYAFCICSSLTSVTIPDSVTSIGEWAFDGCSRISDVYYSGSEEQWNQIVINANNDSLLNANIHFNCDFHEYEQKEVKENIVEATCTTAGSYDSVVYCSECNSELSRENITVNPTGHIDEDDNGYCDVDNVNVCEHLSTKILNYKAATCTVKGYTGDTVCTKCGIILEEGSVIECLAHTYTSSVKEPTCKEEGCTTYTCSVCGYSYNDDFVSKKPHNFKDGFCTECGKKEIDCSCVCHMAGFTGWLFNLFGSIDKFFHTSLLRIIFKEGRVCRCGIAHY